MAGNVFWGVDLGRYALKAVKMHLVRGEVEIQDIVYIPYNLPTGKEEEIQGAVVEAMSAFTEGLNLKNESTAVALPGRVAFSRFIQLPPVDPKKMKDFVSYEAQQQIPFPIGDVVWSFHCLQKEYEAGEEIEVGIFAIKKEIVQPQLDELSSSGIDPDVLTVVPLALLNFVKYDMDPGDETLLVIDIGADHTDLLVLDGDKFWIRNLPFAAKNFTQTIKKKLKVSHLDAEKLKLNLGKSKSSQKILKILQPLYKDLVDEVNRSIGFYKSQASDVRFKKVLLSGSGSKIHGLRKFLQKELRLDVQKISRLTKINIDPYVEVDILRENIEAFGISIGLALQGLGLGETEVNLLPEEKLKAKEDVKKKPFLITTCAVLFLMILALTFLKSAELAKLKDIANQLGSGIKGQPPGAYLSEMQKQVAAEQNVIPLQTALKGMLEIGKSRREAIKILEALNPAFEGNSRLSVKVPADAIPKAPKDKAVIDQVKKGYHDKIWILDLTFEDRFSYKFQKGNMKLSLKMAVHMDGEIESVMKGVVENKLFRTLKEGLKDKLPDEKTDPNQFQEAFQTVIPGNSRRFALFDSEEVKNEEDVFQGIKIFLLKLDLKLNRGKPLVKVEKPVVKPKKRPRKRRR